MWANYGDIWLVWFAQNLHISISAKQMSTTFYKVSESHLNWQESFDDKDANQSQLKQL